MRQMPRTVLASILVLSAGAAVPLATQETFAQSKGDRDLGEYISSQCVTCHQMTGQYDGIPSIVGWPEESFVQIMNEYRHKKRSNPVMQTIASGLSDDEVSALAAYFGGLSPKLRAQ
jgi:cytochrome c553